MCMYVSESVCLPWDGTQPAAGLSWLPAWQMDVRFEVLGSGTAPSRTVAPSHVWLLDFGNVAGLQELRSAAAVVNMSDFILCFSFVFHAMTC